MALKIEKKPFKSRKEHNNPDWDEFLAAIKSVKIGESFVMPPFCGSNHRLALALAIARRLIGARFKTAIEEGGKIRIWRVS